MGISGPPKPPQIARRLEFYPLQLIGLALIMAIPVLALLGVFGESTTHEQRSSDHLVVDVDYATRIRYKTLTDLHVSVRNLTDQPLPTLTLSFSSSYIEQFSTVVFTPSVERISNGRYNVVLSDVLPGETRHVTVELQGERYGLHHGTVVADADDLESVEVDIATLIFP